HTIIHSVSIPVKPALGVYSIQAGRPATLAIPFVVSQASTLTISPGVIGVSPQISIGVSSSTSTTSSVSVVGSTEMNTIAVSHRFAVSQISYTNQSVPTKSTTGS